MERYDIESIIETKTINDKELFLIQWVGYSDEYNTWESAENLQDNPADIIISEQSINSKYFDPEIQMEITPNWANADEILSLINRLRSYIIKKKSNIRVIFYYEKLPNKDTIILKIINHHMYVILYRPQTTSLICDGANEIFAHKDIFNNIQKEFGEIKRIHYRSQERDDHCMSSAIIATLEFIKWSVNNKLIDNEIIPTKTLKNRLIKKLHKYQDSPKLMRRTPIYKQPGSGKSCPNCGKNFDKIKNSKKKLTIIMHTKYCNK